MQKSWFFNNGQKYGDNMVEYGAEDALQDNNVVIRYHNRYLGV